MIWKTPHTTSEISSPPRFPMITMFQPHWLYLLFCKHTHHAPTSAPLNLSFPLPGSTSFIYLHGSPFISLWSLFKCYFIGEDFSDYDHLNYTNLKNFQSSFLIFPSCLLSQHLSPFDLISFLSSFLLQYLAQCLAHIYVISKYLLDE